MVKPVIAVVSLLLLGATSPSSRGVGVTLKVGAKAIRLYSESHALIVGASRYTNGWKSLPGVKKDVAEVTAALQKQGFDVRTVTNPTRAAMDKALRDFVSDFGQITNARLLIYFAGHGHTLTTTDGRQLGYIVPVDAPLPERGIGPFKSAAVSMTEIETIALQIESKHVLFVFDSCFSGSLFDATRSIPDDISERTAWPVRQFITAGTAEQTVPDNSQFRAQFVEGIAGDADRNRDGYVTGTELGDFLQAKITNYTRRAQTPQYGKIAHAGLDRGDFVFAPGPAPAPAVDDAAIEVALWDSIKGEKDAAFFRDYLEKYPNGRFASVARLKIRPPKPGVEQPETKPAEARETTPVKAPAIVPATIPATNLSTAYIRAVAEGKTNAFAKWGEYVTSFGDYFVSVGIYIPKSLGVRGTQATFFGIVRDESGKQVLAFEEPTNLIASKNDFFADKSLSLPAGKFTATLGVAQNGGVVALASTRMQLAGSLDKDATGISQLLLSNNIYALDEAQNPDDPFAFGGVKVIPKADLTFRRSDELWYFFELRNPGGAGSSGGPKIQVKIDVRGTTTGGKPVKMSAPLSRVEAIEMKGVPGHYGVGNAFPLATFQPGNYTFTVRVVDTIKSPSYTLAESFKVTE